MSLQRARRLLSTPPFALELMRRSATTTRPAHAHTNAPRLINPFRKGDAVGGGGGDGFDRDGTGLTDGQHASTLSTHQAGRGRPIVGSVAKSHALWDLGQDAAKWAPQMAFQTSNGKKQLTKDSRVAATLECARAVALDKLRKKLVSASTKAGAGAPPPQAFERWRFAATLESNDEANSDGNSHSANDPVVPSSTKSGEGSAQQTLTSDLTRAGVPADSAAAAAAATSTASKQEATALKKLGDRLITLAKNSDNASKKDSKEKDSGLRLAIVTATFRKRSVDISSDKGRHFVVVSRKAYGKLAAMFRATCVVLKDEKALLQLSNLDPTALKEFAAAQKKRAEEEKPPSNILKLTDSDAEPGDSAGDEEEGGHGKEGTFTLEELETLLGESEGSSEKSRVQFHERLFVLLLRYKSILGYGFQAGVGPLVFESLQTRIGSAFECFASPLNAFHTKGFCSAFPDVDGVFGSRGDFFENIKNGKIKRGSYQVNPPFVSDTMTRAVDAMGSALKAAEKTDQPLSFTVFVPGWTDEPAWQTLSTSKFTKNQFIVAAADHGYCDGASHQRKAKFRSSLYDTGVFFLCSNKALQSQSGQRVIARDGTLFEKDIRTAFAGARFSKEEASAVDVKLTKKRKLDSSNPLIRQFDADTNETPDSIDPNSDGKKSKKEFDGKKSKREKGEKKKPENKAAKKRRKRREEKAKEGSAAKTESNE